jgi:hypothetical protein
LPALLVYETAHAFQGDQSATFNRKEQVVRVVRLTLAAPEIWSLRKYPSLQQELGDAFELFVICVLPHDENLNRELVNGYLEASVTVKASRYLFPFRITRVGLRTPELLRPSSGGLGFISQ